MPAGRYYVGDLCYVIRDRSDWDAVCANSFPPDVVARGVDGEFNLPDGRRYALFGTAYGDGTYNDAEGRRYLVDAGSIGCIRVEDIRDLDDERIFWEGGQIIEFPQPFECDSDGFVISIGSVSINTGDSDYYEGDDDNALDEEY
jgi:hypothetical protein